jgi:hypothetical protein
MDHIDTNGGTNVMEKMMQSVQVTSGSLSIAEREPANRFVWFPPDSYILTNNNNRLCFFHQPLGRRDWAAYQGLMHPQG